MITTRIFCRVKQKLSQRTEGIVKSKSIYDEGYYPSNISQARTRSTKLQTNGTTAWKTTKDVIWEMVAADNLS